MKVKRSISAISALASLLTVAKPALAQTWMQTSAPTNYWSCVASSADGTKLVAAAGDYSKGLVFTSTNSGATWTPASAPSNYWSSVASSADGSKLIGLAVDDGAGAGRAIYVSSDSGAIWSLSSAPRTNWFSAASSADGTKLAAAAIYGPIY